VAYPVCVQGAGGVGNLEGKALTMSWQRIIRHLFVPSVAPAALTWLYFTPKSVFGCANRGYMALAVVSPGIGRGRRPGDEGYNRTKTRRKRGSQLVDRHDADSGIAVGASCRPARMRWNSDRCVSAFS